MTDEAAEAVRQQQLAQQRAQPGEQELARFPLPGGRSVRLLFTGPAPTQREVEKLIALLELSKDTFAVEE